MAVMMVTLLASGNPMVLKLAGVKILFSALALLFITALLVLRPRRVPTEAIWAPLVLVGILAVQVVQLETVSLVSMLGVVVRLITGISALLLIADTALVYCAAMTILASLGIVCYLLDIIIPSLFQLPIVQALAVPLVVRGGEVTAVFYGFYTHVYPYGNVGLRNSGCFWEPGAFAGYLCLGLIFLALARDRMPRAKFRRTAVLLTIALLTTQSTTGYITLLVAVVVLLIGRENQKEGMGKLAILVGSAVVVMAVAYIAFSEVDFLGKKISQQYSAAVGHQRKSQINRFGTALHDWKYIQLRPLTGWGPDPNAWNSLDWTRGLTDAGGNGFSGFVMMYGVIGMTGYLIGVYRGFRRCGGGPLVALCALVVIVLCLQGESFLNYPMFLALVALPAPWAHGARLRQTGRTLRPAMRVGSVVKQFS
jgi:hypothetical protein